MVQLRATIAIEGGGTPPPQMSLSFESADKAFSLAPSHQDFLLPAGEYKMLKPSLPAGYTVKSLTIDGTLITADRINLEPADRDLQLQIVLANAPAPR
jgi:hypothetical protein